MVSDLTKKCLAFTLLAAAFLLPTACAAHSYETIRYDGRDYIACGSTILLDYRLPGAPSFEDLQYALLTRTGERSGSTVYAIKGFDSGWIYCSNESMLGTGPDGVYHSVDVTIDTALDFKPDSLQVYALSKPTADGSGTESLYGGTTDPAVIDRFIKSILSGKALSPYALSEAQKKNRSYDNAAQYRLEFKSSAFPNLIYLYDFTVGTDGKCSVLSDKIGYETDGSLLKLLDQHNI